MSERHNTCPMCNALITYDSSSLPIVCPFCQNPLTTGTTDPSFHHLGEIDPDIIDGGIGEFGMHFIPPGTNICGICRQIYPKQFECCPKLVDLAFAAIGHPTPDWSPKTQDRIVDFLKASPKVVENTIKLRLIQTYRGRIEDDVALQIAFRAKSLGLPVAQSKIFLDWEADQNLESDSDSDPKPDEECDFGMP